MIQCPVHHVDFKAVEDRIMPEKYGYHGRVVAFHQLVKSVCPIEGCPEIVFSDEHGVVIDGLKGWPSDAVPEMTHQAKKGTGHRADIVTLDRSLVVKLGTIAVRAREILDKLEADRAPGYWIEAASANELLRDEEVASWLRSMASYLLSNRNTKPAPTTTTPKEMNRDGETS